MKNIKIAIFFLLIICFPVLLWAGDYLLEPGYEKYIKNKIQRGYYLEKFKRNDFIVNTAIEKRNNLEKIAAGIPIASSNILLTPGKTINQPEFFNNNPIQIAQYSGFWPILPAKIGPGSVLDIANNDQDIYISRQGGGAR